MHYFRTQLKTFWNKSTPQAWLEKWSEKDLVFPSTNYY